MYFINTIKDKYKNQKLSIFVDMDGVIADYDVGKPLDFQNKRPLTTNIKTLEEISHLDNVELYILSICKKDTQIKEKNDWLNKNAPYFKKENRIVISKESHPNIESSILKYNTLKEYNNNIDTKVILIDDDNAILKYMMTNLPEIDIYQDSSIID